MPTPSPSTSEPRKSPVQARSAATVEAILMATIQVLLKLGKDRLTTTRVADRAGVSVGTLYQYFPNKTSLLRAALKRHMDHIRLALETVCLQQTGASLETMAQAVVTTFLAVKMMDVKSSYALYSVSSDVDGARIVREASRKMNRAIVAMLATTSDKLTKDPELVASMLESAMAGVSRRILESPSPEAEYETLRHELIFLVNAYMRACSK